MKKVVLATLLSLSFGVASAADYVIDSKGAHASVNFKVSHLGYSWLLGRFNTFEGTFNYDPAKIEESKVMVTIDTTSLDSNHAERDKHLKSDDFLDAGKFPKATFVSTKVADQGNGKLVVTGDFTMHGVTKSISIDAQLVGAGEDPWGGYRAGFSGTTKINMGDFNFKKNYGDVWLDLHIEGIRQ
ncbi:YceI family protein [Pleionea litopenaei]|uniref:YceI family protein n=1 Tax=Pleionea litopenaei TaxID=3070815 RepID=A0AA51X5Q1_9GAMM|nr:YceI family protein [Pleionea sp. HL-JVS1]WMS86243.1 YceI family protein [Pleionea sp. HL-JVS1]